MPLYFVEKRKETTMFIKITESETQISRLVKISNIKEVCESTENGVLVTEIGLSHDNDISVNKSNVFYLPIKIVETLENVHQQINGM